MVVMMTASAAVADHTGGGVGLEAFCDAHGGTMSVEPGGPACTYTETTEAPAQHGFTLTTSQVFRINVAEFNAHEAPTPVGEPIVSCQNPGGIDVSKDNPNCTPAS
jgi:hypothetical protein